jgi:hypothetical protein
MQLRGVTALAVPRVGRVKETGDPSLPYRLLDRGGIEVAAVSEFLLDMLADDDRPASLRPYAYELLAWFRPVGCRDAVGSCWTGGGSGLRAMAEDGEEAAATPAAGCPSARIDQPGDRQAVRR